MARPAAAAAGTVQRSDANCKPDVRLILYSPHTELGDEKYKNLEFRADLHFRYKTFHSITNIQLHPHFKKVCQYCDPFRKLEVYYSPGNGEQHTYSQEEH